MQQIAAQMKLAEWKPGETVLAMGIVFSPALLQHLSTQALAAVHEVVKDEPDARVVSVTLSVEAQVHRVSNVVSVPDKKPEQPGGAGGEGDGKAG